MAQSLVTGHIFCHLAKNPIQLQSFLDLPAEKSSEKAQSGPIHFLVYV